MWIYTNNAGKHLWLPLPDEWTMDDIKFFTEGKAHLAVKEDADAPTVKPKMPRNKPGTFASPEGLKAPTVEPAKPTVSPEPAAKPEPAESAEKPEPVSLVLSEKHGDESLPVCSRHPNYTGMRMGKKVAECPGCLAVYNERKALGIKETRNKA